MWLKHVLFWPYELMEWLLTPRVETAVMAATGREKAEKTIDRIVGVESWLRRVGLDYIGLGGGGILALGPFVLHMLTGTLSEADLGAVVAKYAYGTMFGLIGIVIISALLLARCRRDRAGMMLAMIHGPWLGIAVWVVVWVLMFWINPIKNAQLITLNLGPIRIIPITLLIFWVASTLLGLAYHGFKGQMRAIDAHPLMPALVVPWFFWGAVIALFGNTHVRNGPDFRAEAIVGIVTAVVVTGFCVMEYRAARTAHGVSLSSGLPPLYGDTWGHLDDHARDPIH